MDIYKPDYTPRQMFDMGIFGGVYFRPIYSNVTKKNYKNQHKIYDFLKDLPESKMNGTFDVNLNKYKVKSGMSLKYWEDHDWIRSQDPYGHVQWYCGFHSGRRTPDDIRQIKRSLKVLIRFGQRSDPSDVVKQALLQWGWDWSKDHSSYISKIKQTLADLKQ
jgi:hypothetical protein